MSHPIVNSTNPIVPTILGVVSLGGNAAVWMDAIKGWAAVATVCLGVPTAFLILVYWAFRVRSEVQNMKKESK